LGITFTATQSASAPNVEDGVYDAWFLSAELKEHADWAGPGKFGFDDGKRFHFDFLLADPENAGEPLYDEGEEVRLDRVTNTNLNVGSKTIPQGVKVLKAILTTAEFAAWGAGQAPNSDALGGRPVQLVIGHKENGWPQIEDVLPARKGFKARAVTNAAAA
jgi:hypothetical protein